jgi:aspartate/methionine/tyrosine aminotransferase
LLTGALPAWVKLREPDWSFDYDELKAAFSPRTRPIIINTPNNPGGKVFDRQELSYIAELCIRQKVLQPVYQSPADLLHYFRRNDTPRVR